MAGLCHRLVGFDVSMGKGTRWIAALSPIAALLLVTSAPAFAEPQVKRAVLGTIVTAGTLEVAIEPGEWKPAEAGSPVLEETELRTLGGRRGLVALGKHGVIGFSKESQVRIGRSDPDGLPVSLEGESELSFRVPATTNMYFLTDSAVVRSPMALPASSADALIQGVIKQRGGETIVSVVEGEVRAGNRDATKLVAVKSGEEVVIAARDGTPRPVASGQEQEHKTRRRLASLGFLGTKKGLLIAGGTVAAVGGGVAAGIAAGGGDGDHKETKKASPFMP
jgi:hypothetical protein